jgi:hypothetical protein
MLRLIYGITFLLVGIVTLLAWALPADSSAGWTISVALALSGAFAIFESRTGWCVIRAIGIRLPF